MAPWKDKRQSQPFCLLTFHNEQWIPEKLMYVKYSFPITSTPPAKLIRDYSMRTCVYLQWKVQRISDSFLPHSYWPRDSGDPSSWCIFYKYCRKKRRDARPIDSGNVISYCTCLHPMNTQMFSKAQFGGWMNMSHFNSVWNLPQHLNWPAVVCPLRLDAAALGALVDDLTRL